MGDSNGNGNGKQRTPDGKFAPGNQASVGRRGPTAGTLDVRRIRADIVKSWFEGNAYETLVKLIKEDPVAYFRLVASVLPKEITADIDIGHPVRPDGMPPDEWRRAKAFVTKVQAFAGRPDPGPDDVLRFLDDDVDGVPDDNPNNEDGVPDDDTNSSD